ncbi:COG1361 S-layer family protein [Candidatus Woesearchaeota archaeon]|nr:COG1361 S-layer family protein [Candidatus Woesearchaeota archaeon]
MRKETGVISVIMVLMLASMAAAATSSSQSAQVQPSIVVSLVSQDPDPAIAGDLMEVRLSIANVGDISTNNMVVAIEPTYPFEILPGTSASQSLGTILGGQGFYSDNAKIIKFQLKVDKDVSAGSYALKIKTYQQDNPSITSTTTLTLDVNSQDSAEIIYIDQVELVPGKIIPLKFTINNVGSTPLRDLTFHWENEDDIILPVGSDNTKYVKYIDVGDSADLLFNVIASTNAAPDLYKLDLTLTYTDPLNNVEKEINTKAGVYVGGATDFDVAFSGTTNGESTFSISNVGSVSASSVTVKIPGQPGWRVSGSDSVIIGNLNEGDYTIAGFTLQPMGGARPVNAGTSAGTIPMTGGNFTRQFGQANVTNTKILIDIVYTDSRGNRNTITKEVPVDAASFSSGATAASASVTTTNGFGARKTVAANPLTSIWSNAGWMILAVVAIALLVAVRRKRNNKRLDDPDYGYGDALKDLFSGNGKKKKR